jgi:hypothetical protein
VRGRRPSNLVGPARTVCQGGTCLRRHDVRAARLERHPLWRLEVKIEEVILWVVLLVRPAATFALAQASAFQAGRGLGSCAGLVATAPA